MKTQNEVFKWLKANCGKHCLGALTDHDARALLASVAITPLISWKGGSQELFDAYRAIVSEMQPSTRWLAFHAIAMELDWSHRFMIWRKAGLAAEDMPKFKAAHEPGGSARIAATNVSSDWQRAVRETEEVAA